MGSWAIKGQISWPPRRTSQWTNRRYPWGLEWLTSPPEGLWMRLWKARDTVHWRANGNPLQYSCLENPRDGVAWWAAIYGVAQSWTRLKWLSSSRDTVSGNKANLASLRATQRCLRKRKSAQCESFKWSFTGGKMRTAARSTAPQIALRNCSIEAAGKVSICEILVKGEYMQSCTYLSRRFLLVSWSFC